MAKRLTTAGNRTVGRVVLADPEGNVFCILRSELEDLLPAAG